MKDDNHQRLPGQLKTGSLNVCLYRTDPLQPSVRARVGELELLLRRLPRMATVRAPTDAYLQA
jgi:hypothetical protein